MAYALDEITNAYDITKDFLLPFSLYRWLKLTIITFFVGYTGFQMNYFPFNSFGGGDTPTNGFEMPSMGMPGLPELTIILLIVGVIIIFVLIFLLLSSIFEFIFVESLRKGEVKIRNYWSRYWRQGFRLAVFRFFIGFLPIIAGVLIFLFVILSFLNAGTALISIGLLFLLIPIFIVFALLIGVIDGFTTSFVVPAMILEDCGVLDGWRRFWPTLKGEWKEYLVYLILSWILGLVGSLIVGIVGFLILLIPGAILTFIGFISITLFEGLGLFVFVVLALLLVICLIIIFSFVNVPVLVYLRYYALLVLGDTDEGLDIIPKQRKNLEE